MSGPAARPVISVIGDLAADYYLILPQRQEGDEKRTATRSLRLPGGTGANAATTAAVLGSQVMLYSVVGTNQLPAWRKAGVAARGVNTSGVRVAPADTTHTTILLQPRDRQVTGDSRA